MNTRKIKTINTTTIYILAVVVIIVAFLLLGGGTWMRGMHGSMSMGMSHLNWTQILISLIIGFILGLLASRRKW